MATATVSHHPNPGAISRTLGARSGGTARELYRRGLKVQARARQLVGVDTGHLRSRIQVELIPAPGGGWAARVYVDQVHYAKHHHDGHGWIYPRRAGGVLRFTVAGRVVYATKVGPVAGTRFLERALAAGRR